MQVKTLKPTQSTLPKPGRFSSVAGAIAPIVSRRTTAAHNPLHRRTCSLRRPAAWRSRRLALHWMKPALGSGSSPPEAARSPNWPATSSAAPQTTQKRTCSARSSDSSVRATAATTTSCSCSQNSIGLLSMRSPEATTSENTAEFITGPGKHGADARRSGID